MKTIIAKIRNFATFTSKDGGKVRIVRNEAGEETGFELSGMLTTFNVANENGLVFHSESYDKFVDEYFVAHSINVPLCLLHNDGDIRDISGYVKSMTKTESGVEMTAFVPRAAYYYNLIKAYVDAGILQGFSNAGGVTEGWYDKETGDLHITGFALQHVALVCTPSDTSATFVANTAFNGFESKKEDKQEGQAGDDWRDIV